MRHMYYNMEGEPISEEEAMGLFGDSDDRIVAQTRSDEVLVSTVLLVINHQWNPDGPPIIFETMIFGGERDQDQWRYSTLAEAEDGHREACKLAFPEWVNQA